MKLAFTTFGCKANSFDTDILLLEAKKRGHLIVEPETRADAYIINSCTVTRNADLEAKHLALKIKRENPSSLVAVIGCYAQVGKKELLDSPEIDLVVGTANKLETLNYLENFDRTRDRVQNTLGFLPRDFLGSRHARASVKIQDGCNFKCSYCIIPQARGRSRSLGVETVIQQVMDARDQGFQEVILTAVHLAHYGWELNTNLEKLLWKLVEIPEGPRIRLTSLDPFEISDGLIELVCTHPRICPHFHIALQSGSEIILKNMRRLYKPHEFSDVTAKVRAKNPSVFIGADVIVGFPGETEKEFQETVSFLENSWWTKLHVFPFSVRPGTKAETLDGKVSPQEKKYRSEFLRKLSDCRYEKFMASQLKRSAPFEIVLEKEKTPGKWFGHTENYLPVFVSTEARRRQKVEKKAAEITLAASLDII